MHVQSCFSHFKNRYFVCILENVLENRLIKPQVLINLFEFQKRTEVRVGYHQYHCHQKIDSQKNQTNEP